MLIIYLFAYFKWILLLVEVIMVFFRCNLIVIEPLWSVMTWDHLIGHTCPQVEVLAYGIFVVLQPFWRLWNAASSQGRGVIGVVSN